MANFAPGTDITGEGVRAVEDEPNVFESPGGLRHYMLTAAALDAEFALRGLSPIEPTRTVEVSMKKGRRLTVNALYASE